jgi:hypothetical protein
MSDPGTSSANDADFERSQVGAAFVGRNALIVIVLGLLVASAITLLQLWIFWPTSLESPQTNAATTATGELPSTKIVNYLGIAHFTLSTEDLFFVVVALAGALGGLVHTIRSVAIYVGTRRLRWSWIAYYLLLPLVGALGGTLFYVVLRAGLFSPSTEVSQASPFGFAAVAALVGLFSQQALEKLRQLAQQVFAEVESPGDHFEPEPGGGTDSSPPSKH